jgi:hypothetical protein
LLHDDCELARIVPERHGDQAGIGRELDFHFGDFSFSFSSSSSISV